MSSLQYNPASRARTPAYPTKLAVLATPNLLDRHQPPAWLSNRELAAAVGVFLTANATGCRSTTPPSGVTENVRSALTPVVAPLFERGPGRVYGGCIVVAPPVTLSEEEAIQVIVDEMRVHGVDLSQRNLNMPGVRVPRREAGTSYEWVSDEQGGGFVTFDAPLNVDLADAGQQIAVEFVSITDVHGLAGPWHEEEGWSSVSSLDIKEVAAAVSEHAREGRPHMTLGLFYDPAVGKFDFNEVCQSAWGSDGDLDRQEMNRVWKEIESAAKEKSKAALRQQVQDFAEWLKGQGVM